MGGNPETTQQIIQEVHIQYPDIQEFALSEMDFYDASQMTSTRKPVIYLRWKDGGHHPEAERKLAEWLKVRLKSDDIKIVRNQ